MKLLALDLGTKTGWAASHKSQLMASGMQEQKTGRFDGGGMRYLRFRNWLFDIRKSLDGLDAVYFEEVHRHLGTDAAHVYGGLLAHLTAWCEEQKIPYQGVPVQTIKSHATGKGNAKKELMKEAALKLWGNVQSSPGDDNEADALCLLHWAIKQQPSGSRVRERIKVRL